MNMIGMLCTMVRPVAVRRNTPCLRSVCFSSAGSNRAFKALPKYFGQTAEGAGRFICYRLPSRALLKVYGQDTSSFLQGMITNDVNLLGDGEQKSLYAHMLNVKGRSLYDIIIYRLNELSEGLDNVLLECDSAVLGALTQHLKTYKIRRKVAVDACADLSLWALLPLDTHSIPQPPGNPPIPTAPGKALVLVPDPRTHLMGWRLITRTSDSPLDFIAACQQGDPDEYHSHRYKIGLPEGVRDLLPGEALPLESNLEYMNGISFSKGCYIGQELTARTHHTGVVRKRLMPVRLSAPAEPLQEGADLQSPEGKSAGKHRAGIGRVGLSLVRTAHVGEVLTLTHSQDVHVTLEASVPDWWPKDTKS